MITGVRRNLTVPSTPGASSRNAPPAHRRTCVSAGQELMPRPPARRHARPPLRESSRCATSRATPAPASCHSCLRMASPDREIRCAAPPNPHFHSMLFVRVSRLLTVLGIAQVCLGVVASAQVDLSGGEAPDLRGDNSPLRRRHEAGCRHRQRLTHRPRHLSDRGRNPVQFRLPRGRRQGQRHHHFRPAPSRGRRRHLQHRPPASSPRVTSASASSRSISPAKPSRAPSTNWSSPTPRYFSARTPATPPPSMPTA